MSVQTDLEERTARLTAILEDSNEAVAEKGGTAQAADLTGIPAAIRAIPESIKTEPVLESITVTPTGETFTRYPSADGFSSVTVKGDSDLIPENIIKGAIIYGVAGSATGVVSDYPVMEVPDEYLEYVQYARENFYSMDYAHLVVWDVDDWIAVSFLMSDFAIQSFNPLSTELTATGWFTCGYTKSTGEWTSHDYRNTESPGGNYAKYIVFASCEIEYNGERLFPVGITNMPEVSSIAWDDANLTANINFASGEVVAMSWTEDAEGNATSITVDGHTITVTEVS